MKTFEDLPQEEKNMLLKFPAYISLLATSSDGKIDTEEKKEAIHFTHIKTFSCDPLLYHFYDEVEKVFEKNIEELDQQLPENSRERKLSIQQELSKLEPILEKLGSKYAEVMHKSMNSYIKHVSKAHNNVLETFFIPLHIKGLTD
jgi:hypothetical protein